jgi:phosphate uptake regulator
MEVRKIIKLGDSTLCVSLPKFWTEQFHLEKGDHLSLDSDSDGNILIVPSGKTIAIEETKAEIIIGRKSDSALRQEITLAYINGCSEVIVKGDILNRIESLRTIFSSLMGLEMMAPTKKIALGKVLLDIDKVSIKNTIEKIGLLVGESFENIEDSLIRSDRSADALGIRYEIERLANLGNRAINTYLGGHLSKRCREFSITGLVSAKHQIHTLIQIEEHLSRLDRDVIRNSRQDTTTKKDQRLIKSILLDLKKIFRNTLVADPKDSERLLTDLEKILSDSERIEPIPQRWSLVMLAGSIKDLLIRTA